MPPNADDGRARTRSLKPAAENPWYVLATINGEQTEDRWDSELHARNRRSWNGWFCKRLADAKREKLVTLTGLDAREFLVSNEAKIENEFAARRMSLPSAINSVILSYSLFAKPLDMSGFVFHKPARFNGSAFHGGVNFGGALFKEYAKFDGATFDRLVSFKRARFNSTAWFESAAFSENARFGSVRFKGSAHFSSTDFGKQAWFDSAEFHQSAWFNRSTFNELAVFERSVFRDSANFSEATFSRNSSFNSATFKETANFLGCQFDHPTSFNEARFLTRFPNLHGAILHLSTTFTAKDEFWPQTAGASAEQSRGSLASIRHAVGKQGLPEEEHYFYRREMAFAARIGTPLERLPYQAFGALSDFGYSLAKPALWLGGSWFIGFLAYSYWLTWLAPTLADAHPLYTAAGFSVAQLFGFLGFTGSYFRADFLDALPTALKVLAGLQTVAGVVLLFFLGLGLRNRFRLK